MKDYYAILGVTPQAEDVVIKAAYRALAQRYHPDRFAGSAEEATRKMADINEAYAVLSDPIKKKAYDEEYQQFDGGAGDFDAGDAAADEGVKQIDQDWEVALEYYPDLAQLEASLAKTSKSLAFTYRLCIIVEKAYKQRKEIAEALQFSFLSKFFGEQKAVLDFAKSLIAMGRKDAAKALNEAVRVLGDDLEPALVINKIKGRFGLMEASTRTPGAAPAKKRFYQPPEKRPPNAIDVVDNDGSILSSVERSCFPNASANEVIRVIELLGGEATSKLFGGYTVNFKFLRHQFDSPEGLCNWFAEDVLPRLYFV